MNLAHLIAPELFLVAAACVLFLLGTVNRPAARHLAAVLALATLLITFAFQAYWAFGATPSRGVTDQWNTLNVGGFATYIKVLVSGVGAILVLLAWPTNRDATGSPSISFGHEAGEFFGLMLLSITGVFLVADSNDIILLFLGVELASIPTYVMVSVSRPLPVAQEAGVKYFFLGAMAAAVMLFGFSYLYGTTGKIKLNEIAQTFDAARPDTSIVTSDRAAGEADVFPDAGHVGPVYQTVENKRGYWNAAVLQPWHFLAIIMLLAGLAFKIAAVPMHAYVGDVYQGAATPVTAFLAFVPKISGFVAILKVLFAVGGQHWAFHPLLVNLVVVVAILTMTVGNVLGLLQLNVKRVLAYSSVAHSGYMLVGVAALMHAASNAAGAGDDPKALAHITAIQESAFQGVLFYLAAYGAMNAGAFGVLMLLPSRTVTYGGGATSGGGRDPHPLPATSAETFEDLAGTAKRHPWLGLAMAVSCFSLIGLPFTVGLVGKLYLVGPAFSSGLYGLVIVMMVNSAISAAYYLKIIATMYLRASPDDAPAAEAAMAAEDDARSEPASAGRRQETAGGSMLGVPHARPIPIRLAVAVSAILTVLLGTYLPAPNALSRRLTTATLDRDPAGPTNAVPLRPPAAQMTAAADTPAHAGVGQR